MIHIATISALFIAILVQTFPNHVPYLPVQIPFWAFYTFYFLLLLRWPIAPFVLNRVSKGMALVDSVSLRSIKGIRFTVPNIVKVECDRLGYSIHLFGKKANRRIGVTFEGLRLTILHVPSEKKKQQQQQTEHARARSASLTHVDHTSLSVLPQDLIEESANKASPILEWLKYVLPDGWVQSLDDASRAWIRYIFSLSFDFLLHVAPSIISTLSLRLSNVQVTFVELNGVYFTLANASLGVSVALEVVPEHQMTDEQRRELRIAQRSRAKSWKDRLTGSFSRTFMAAWKGRQGTATVSLQLKNFTLSNPTPPPARKRALSTISSDSGWVHFTDIDVNAPENAVLHIPGQSEFSAKCDFDPRRGQIAHHSVRLNAAVADVTVFVDVLQKLMADVQSMLPKSSKVYEPQSPSPMPSLDALASPTSPATTPITPPHRAVTLPPAPSRKFSFSFSPPRAKPAPKKLKDRNIMLYFNSVGVQMPRFILQYTSTKSREPIQYKSQIIGLDLGMKLSDPMKDPLHLKWLGKSGKPKLDTCLAWFRFTDVIVHRDHDLNNEDGMVRIVKTAGLDAQVLLHQFPPPLVKRTGDATEAFVACEVDMESIEATETLDLLRKRLARPPQQKPLGLNKPRESQQQPLKNLPKVSVDIRIADIKGRVIYDDEKVFPHDVGIDVQLDSAEFHIRSDYDQFKAPLRTSKTKANQGADCFPQYNFKIDAAVHSPFVRIVQASSDEETTASSPIQAAMRHRLGAPSHGGVCRLDDPILLLEGLEFGVVGNMLGKWNGEDVALERQSLMADTRLIVDAVQIGLWSQSSLSVLAYFVSQVKKSSAKSKRTQPTVAAPPSTKTLLDSIPTGVQFQAAIGSLVVGVTGKDINPDCTLELHRGIIFSTSFMFRYASMQTSLHNARTRDRFKMALSRDRLRLSEDLLMQAFAYANQSDDTRSVSALTEMIFSNVTLRRIVGTQFGVDESELVDNIPTSVSAHGLTLSIPRIRSRSFVTRRPGPGTSLVDSINITLDINAISGYIQLLDAYCSLLAVQTLQKLAGAQKKPKTEPVVARVDPSEQKKIHIDIAAQVASAQLICQLPIGQVLQARLSVLNMKLTDAKTAEIKWTAASILAPSGVHQAHRRWEEMARLPSWRVSLGPDTTTKKPLIQVVGDSARIRIPNGYILSDMILSLTVAIKAAKHLVDITTAGKFTPMETPPSEEAKIVPNIHVQIDSLMFEATDSPIEARLNLAFRQNLLAQRIRVEHEEAFDAKVAKIEAEQNRAAHGRREGEWNFTSEHSVGIQEARHRLRELFSNLWVSQIQDAKAIAMVKEENLTMRFREGKTVQMDNALPLSLYVPPNLPPLFRLTLNGVSVAVRSPNWDEEKRTSFMEDLGRGLPKDTQFTLLVPLHLEVAVDSARFVLRDLPLPLLNVPPCADRKALTFTTDLVIGEEIGPEVSVRWVECDIATENADAPGTAAFNILIPKTTMPVKTYAEPEVQVNTNGITDMCWGVSYLPIMQEVMRVIDTLSTLPIDPSPPLGFWDKLRLILHWRVRVKFNGEVHVHLKGSRDAWKTSGTAVGIALCARRNTRIIIGHPNPENELIQLISDDMLIVVPSLKHFENAPSGMSSLDYELGPGSRQPQKVIAKLTSGVRIGMGFALERSCRSSCLTCHPEADPFHRTCRIFDFKPHYQVALRVGSDDGTDSYEGFRSDFIHGSISMHSPIHSDATTQMQPNSIHLTPRVFSHFWSWVKLFDDALALPIRQGKMWPDKRPPSEKLGRHLATLKYRIVLDNLAISHTYKQDSQDSWAHGEVPVVGVKALVNSLRVDLHQRDQEIRSHGKDGSLKFTRTKSLYGAEVNMTELFMRAVVAIYREPDLQFAASHTSADYESPYTIAPPASPSDEAFDNDDYTELDWLPTDRMPKFYMGEVASCPEFSFVKKIEILRQPSDDPTLGVSKMSKFGSEDSHTCLMGMEFDPRTVHLSMARERKAALETELQELSTKNTLYDTKRASIVQRINLLDVYIEKLLNPPPSATPSRVEGSLHGNWSASDWESFDNLYHVYAPKLSLDNGTRNILLQYYYESRKRRGFEYHMASSAVRFIREHALATETRKEEPQQPKLEVAQGVVRNKSTNAVKRLFTRQSDKGKQHQPVAGPADVDVNLGADHRTQVHQSHFVLLFKPQIVLRSNLDDESVIIIAANDAAVQTTDVMDGNTDDPVDGHMLTKIHFILSGMQIFSPSPLWADIATGVQLPYEVFLDDLCETVEYDRIVRHTSCLVQYDKYNRLRLRTASQNTPQTDLLMANVPRFTLQANSDHFTSLYHVITDLLLYSDPSNRSRIDRLESFILNDDISDSATTASEIAFRQRRIRALSEQLNDFTLRQADLRSSERLEMNQVAARVMAQAEELGLIFDAIQSVQQRDEQATKNKVGIRLEASSSDITWNLMDKDGSLFMRLALRAIDFLWISSQDGSSANRLKIKDLEALDARPNAKFPQMISKQTTWLKDHPMAKKDTLIEAVWTTAAPVGGISILTNFDFSFHPINAQFDASVGHKLQTYIFPKDKSSRYHNSQSVMDTESDLRKSPDTPDSHTTFDVPSRSSLDERSSRTLLRAPRPVSRSSSHSDLGRGDHDGPRLRRTHSNHNLDAPSHQEAASSVALTKTSKGQISDGVAEMRARSAENRTFVAARINPSGICLSFRRDKDLSIIIPDIHQLNIETPDISFGNRTCSFHDLVLEFKWDFITMTSNVVLSASGLKSFKFSGIRERFTPSKRNTTPAKIEAPPKPPQRQLTGTKGTNGSETLSSADSSGLSDTGTGATPRASTSSHTTSSIGFGRRSTSSNRHNSSSSGNRGVSDHEEVESATPRKKLMTLLNRTASPRHSPSIKVTSMSQPSLPPS
ncbi:hypothetical protein FS842_001402 [Serendipita sp. 407]|nr:hypothetical protein FS842_001402 [Serendipita sp. 407]